MSTPIIMRECNADSYIDAGAPVTITGESGGVYAVRAAVDGDPVDGTAASTAAANDMVTVATPPSFGQRLTE